MVSQKNMQNFYANWAELDKINLSIFNSEALTLCRTRSPKTERSRTVIQRRRIEIRLNPEVASSAILLASEKNVSFAALVEMSLHRTCAIAGANKSDRLAHWFTETKSRRIIPDSVVRRMIEDKQQGLSYRQISRKYGYGLRTCNRAVDGRDCYAWVRRYSSPGRPPKLASEQREEIIRALAKGESKKLLALKYRVSAKTIDRVEHGR